MNYTYMKGCALCMTLCLTSAALPGRANAESSAIVNESLAVICCERGGKRLEW